jgi:uncharacterized membrane protein
MRDNLSQRPRVEVARTFPDYLAEILALIGVLFVITFPILSWTDLPEQLPRHFGITGSPTAWGGSGTILFPAILATLMYGGLTLVARIPHCFNYPWQITEENAAIQYRLARSMIIWLKALIVWMFLYIMWSQVRVALGEESGMEALAIMLFLVGIHVLLGIFLYRAWKCRSGSVDDDPFSF